MTINYLLQEFKVDKKSKIGAKS